MNTRGEKRRCQSEDCATMFYDLNRDTFACPTCGTVFDLEVDAAAKEAPRSDTGFSSRKKAREFQITAPEEAQPAGNDNDGDAAAGSNEETEDDTPADDGDNKADVAILDEEDDDDAASDAVPQPEADNDDPR